MLAVRGSRSSAAIEVEGGGMGGLDVVAPALHQRLKCPSAPKSKNVHVIRYLSEVAVGGVRAPPLLRGFGRCSVGRLQTGGIPKASAHGVLQAWAGMVGECGLTIPCENLQALPSLQYPFWWK